VAPSPLAVLRRDGSFGTGWIEGGIASGFRSRGAFACWCSGVVEFGDQALDTVGDVVTDRPNAVEWLPCGVV
jgi:hypothetical protein